MDGGVGGGGGGGGGEDDEEVRSERWETKRHHLRSPIVARTFPPCAQAGDHPAHGLKSVVDHHRELRTGVCVGKDALACVWISWMC